VGKPAKSAVYLFLFSPLYVNTIFSFYPQGISSSILFFLSVSFLIIHTKLKDTLKS